MRHKIISLGVFTGMVALAGCGESTAPTKPVTANLESSQGASILFIDVNKILSESKAYKDIKRQMDEYTSTYQQTISAKEKDLKAVENRLLEQQKKLAPSVFESKQKEFTDKVNELQRSINERNIELQNAHQQALESIQKHVTELLKKKYPGHVVQPTSVAIAFPEELEVTTNVLEELDKSLTSVKVNVESAKSADKAS